MPNNKYTSVLSIVVTYNAENWLDTCLNSLLESSIKTDIVVVDNASSDKTLSIISQKYPLVNLVKQEKNLGFGKANNLGFRKALSEGYNFVFLLNQDAAIKKYTLERLISCSKENPSYGILSPLQYYDENNLDYLFEFYLRKLEKVITYLLNYKSNPSKNNLIDIPFVNAAIWLITSKCLKKMGGFDPLFQHYGEDVEFCNRARYYGFKAGVCFDTEAYHFRKQGKKNYNTFNKIHNKYYINFLVEMKKLDKPTIKCLLLITRGFLSLLMYYIKRLNITSFMAVLKAYFDILKNYRTIYENRKKNLIEDISFIYE